MGQSTHPRGYRLAVTKDWNSVWHSDKNYVQFLHEDLAIRKYLNKELSVAGLDRIYIKRSINQVDIDIHVAKPGMVIGRGGSRVEEIKKHLTVMTEGKMNLNILEIRKPDLSAKVVAHDIAARIERRMSYKKVVLRAMQKVMDAGAKGIKVHVSGRLNGNAIARLEKRVQGSVPTSTITADVDYSLAVAHTKKGTIGVKVWIAREGKDTK